MVNTRRPKRNAGAPARDPTPVKPASKVPSKAAAKPAEDKASGKKVRVWWAPTKDKKRSGYSGMYWPATFVKKGATDMIHVKYDNGEAEEVDMEAVAPANVPMDFGAENSRLDVGEFCEVFNNSTTDPAAWVGRVAKVNKKTYQVEYPFHDAEAELIKEELIRRARVWVESENSWKFVKPFQTWPDGEITNPWELQLVSEKELKKALKEGGAPSPPVPAPAPEKKKEAPKKAPAPPHPAPAPAPPAPAVTAAIVATPTPPAAAPPATAPATAVPPVAKPPAKRGRPKKTEEQKAEDAAKKRARKAEEEAMAAVLAAAPPAAPAMPQMPTMPGLGMMPGGTPANMQALQGLLSAPNMLPLLQGLMAAQSARPAVHTPTAPAMGMSMPMAQMQPIAAPMAPKTVPTPPEAIHIPPLPAPEEEEEEPLVESVVEEDEAEEEEGKKKKRKKKVLPLIQVPKKARSAYILFSMDFRKKVPANTDFNEATRQAAALWKDADEATRKKFEEMANVEREEHAKKQSEYLEKKKILDAKLAARIARQQAHTAAVKAHEEAKMKQLELNAAYHRACAMAGVVPQPVPQVPGASSLYLEASTSASEEDAIATQINKLDMEKARKHILKYYHEDAFYILVDTWRRDSPKLNDALSSAKCHVFSKLRADWKAFMIGTFGKDVMDSMLRKEGDAPPAAEEE